jgi:hypothetical protein
MKKSGELKDNEKGEGDAWRFRLDAEAASGAEADRMVELTRIFLADFLRIGFLSKNGVRVDADGFAFVPEPDALHKIFPDKAVL